MWNDVKVTDALRKKLDDLKLYDICEDCGTIGIFNDPDMHSWHDGDVLCRVCYDRRMDDDEVRGGDVPEHQ